jgi:hypothetical protein
MEGLVRANLQRSGPFQFHPFPSDQMPGHRFPAPWSSEEHAAHFVIRDNNGQAIAYVYNDRYCGLRLHLHAETKKGH